MKELPKRFDNKNPYKKALLQYAMFPSSTFRNGFGRCKVCSHWAMALRDKLYGNSRSVRFNQCVSTEVVSRFVK